MLHLVARAVHYKGWRAATLPTSEVSTMIKLYNAETGAAVGDITADQLAFLQAQLEEENSADQDYYLNGATLDLFTQRGADPALIAVLRQALGQQEEMDIRWEQA